MEDFLGNELSVGDNIVYCTRRGSWMNQNATKIVEIIPYKKYEYVREPSGLKFKKVEVVLERLLVRNPNWKPFEERTEWEKEYYRTPEHVTLRIPEYIVKVN